MKAFCLLLLSASIALAQPGLNGPEAGAFARVAASGGGGITDYTNNLIINLFAESITASDGANQSTWADVGPNAYTFTTDVGHNAYFTNSVSTLNNKKGMVFLSSRPAYYVKAITGLSARNYTVIAVIQPFDGANSANEIAVHFSSGGGQTCQYNVNTGANQSGWTDNAGGNTHNIAANTAAAQILSWELNSTGTAGTMYRNGTQIGSAAAYTAAALDSFTVACYQNLSAAPFNGIIACLRVYDGDITSANRLKAEEALGQLYGITVP